MAEGSLRRLFWCVADDLDYLMTLVRLRILDALADPEPEAPADQQRARDREQIERAFPKLDGCGAWRRDLPLCGSCPDRKLSRITPLPSSLLPGGPATLGPMDQPEDAPTLPARYYRRKAAEARRAAEGVTTQAVKARLHGLVRDFDRLADAADSAAQTPDALAGVILRQQKRERDEA